MPRATGAAGVDDRPRVVGPTVVAQHRVGLAAPRLAHDLDVLGRVGARADRPHHILEVGRIDVLVDHDHVTVHVGRGLALGRDVAGLARVAAVALLDRDRQEQPPAAALVGPDAAHVRNAGLHQGVVDHGRLHRGAPVGVVVRRLTGWRSEQDRVVAEVETRDIDGRDRHLAAGVVAGPFAIGPFGQQAVLADPTLDGDLAAGRYGQAGHIAADYFERAADHCAGVIELADAGRHLGAGHHQEDRVVAEGDGDRSPDFAAEPFVDVLPSVLAGDGIDGSGATVLLNLHAVSAAVDAAAVRVAGQNDAAGAEVAAAVVLVPEGRRESQEVHVRTFDHVLEDGS